jgi:hypothetical protein
MFLIRLILIVGGLFAFMVLFTGLSIMLRVRRHLQNPFTRQTNNPPPPPPGKGAIIEGEYKVIDDNKK